MDYAVVAEAYADLERTAGRLLLIDRLAELLRQTPDSVLPTVCYLCQGQVAPEFAAVDLGLAEKLAVRAVATATGAPLDEVVATVRAAGDLGQATEALLQARAANRPTSLQVEHVVDSLHEIARAEGTGSQGRKLDLLTGLLAQATPLEGRYLLRLVTRNLRLGIGTPTILDALAIVHAGGRTDRPALERAYNICCDLGLVAETLVSGGLDAVARLRVRPGHPARVMLAQRLSDAAEILAKLGGSCAAEHKYDGMRVQAHRTADGQVELFTRRQERVNPVPRRGGAAGHRPAPARGDHRGRDRGLRCRGRGAPPVPGGHVPTPPARDRAGRPGRPGRVVLLRAAVRRRRGLHRPSLSGTPSRARRGRGASPIGSS